MSGRSFCSLVAFFHSSAQSCCELNVAFFPNEMLIPQTRYTHFPLLFPFLCSYVLCILLDWPVYSFARVYFILFYFIRYIYFFIIEISLLIVPLDAMLAPASILRHNCCVGLLRKSNLWLAQGVLLPHFNPQALHETFIRAIGRVSLRLFRALSLVRSMWCLYNDVWTYWVIRINTTVWFIHRSLVLCHVFNQTLLNCK